MKQAILCTLVLCLAVIPALADRSTLDDTKTRIAMPLPEPPVIDGFIDTANGESWVYAAGAQPDGNSYWTFVFDDTQEDFIQGAHIGNGGIGPIDGTDIGVEIYVGYDSENLYVAVRVVDDIVWDDSAEAGSVNGSTWLDDSVEVFVDGDNSNYPERDTAGAKPEGWSTGGQYVVTNNNAIRSAEAGDPSYGPDAEWYGLSDVNAQGNQDYEFRISLDLLGNPQPGDIIGFDISVNDDDDGGDTLENQYVWSGNTHVEATYGNLVLGARQYTAPKVSAAPTIDGTIASGEYDGAPEIDVTNFSGNYNGNDDFGPGDHDWKAWVVHDDEAIYVAVDVVDDIITTDTAAAGTEDGSTWEDDSAEVFFDTDFSRDRGRTSSNLFEGQYVLTPNGAWRDNEANNPLFGEADDWFGVAGTTATGYVLEFKFLKEAFWELTNPIGFDIAVNDDDGDGSDRKTQLAWNGRPHNESSYGILTLSDTGGVPVADWSLY